VGLGVPEDYPRAPSEARGLIPRRPAPALKFVTEVNFKVKINININIKVKINTELKNKGGQNGFGLRLEGRRIFTWA